MKNSVPIPSDVWEEKKALISTLYKDEEWPLKQVIKKIRSDNFNPSETQLRSRLKKWRVTKPSRQTKKKSEETTKCLSHETNIHKRHSNNSSRETQPRSLPLPLPLPLPSATEAVVTEQEWCIANKVYEAPGSAVSSGGGRDIPAAWDPNPSYSSPQISPDKSRVGSHASLAITTPPSYDPPQPSPLMDGTLLNSTPTMTPTFTNSLYALGADHSVPTPVSTTAVPEIQWAIPQWYSMPIETTTEASSMLFYTSGPLTPPIDPMVNTVSQQPVLQISESQGGLKLWKPTVSGSYSPGLAAQISQNARQLPKSLEKEVQHPPKVSASQHLGVVATPTSPFFPHGSYSSSLCSPGYAYPGPEPLIHRSSIEF